MDNYRSGLRSQDVNAGLRTFHAASSRLTPLKNTRLVGMAADLAALVRGREIISDMSHLEMVAADELDIPDTSFDSVLLMLEEAEMVQVTRVGQRITGLTSDVPAFGGLYERLGRTWRDRQPTQLEEEVLVVVDRLAQGPIARDSLASVTGIDDSDVDELISLGFESELVKQVQGIDGSILYSPFTAFENPDVLTNLAEQHGNDQMATEFNELRGRQGLAIDAKSHPFLIDAVGRGLVIAPAVALPNGGMQPFAALPYAISRDLLTGQKPVLDKALAIIACVRCGEQFGGFSALPDPVNAVAKLMREGELSPHSSSRRQYGLLVRKGILEFAPDPVPWGRWVVPTLIDTEDNRMALALALELLSDGEVSTGRNAEGAQELLSVDNKYIPPLRVTSAVRKRLDATNPVMEAALAGVFGWGVAS